MTRRRAIHEPIDTRLGALGGRLDPIVHWPHAPGSGDPMRKPAPGMLAEIARREGNAP